MTISVALEQIILRWQGDDIHLLPPKKETEIAAAFGAVGFQASPDVINLYCATGGMEDGESDSCMFSLWSLERVVAENIMRSRSFVSFADALIDSYFYCFKYESANRSFVYVDYLNGEEPQLMANSVDEFFKLYLKNPESIGLIV